MKKTNASHSVLLGLLGAAWLSACGGAELAEPSVSPSYPEQTSALVTLPIRINVGGGAFTDTYGRVWQADTGSSCFCSAFQTAEPITGTENDGLYQAMRIGESDISYEIPVPGPGIYTVQFLFIEPEKNLASPRNMNIMAEGQTQVDQYVGLVTPLRSYTLFFDVPVRDSSLSLWLRANPGSPPPVLSAIEVTASKWSWLGGSPLDSSSYLRGKPALAMDGNNRPVVAWVEDSSASTYPNVAVARWTGSAYQRLGGALGDGRSMSPNVMVDASGAPVVAFVQSLPLPTGVRVRVRRWTGTAWSEVGGLVGLDGYEAQSVASAFDRQGQPVLAVVLLGTGGVLDARLHVYRFNGVAWDQVGDAVAATGTGARPDTLSNPSIAVDPTDRIVVAWSEQYNGGYPGGTSYTHVFRRNNGLWTRVGTQVPASGAAASQAPSLALAPDGTPWVAYRKAGVIDVVREQNGAWVATPNAGLKGWPGTSVDAGAPLLRIDGAGTPKVLLLERKTSTLSTGRVLRQWNGTAWVAASNSVGPIDTTFATADLFYNAATDMGFVLNSSGLPVVAIPEDLPSGASYGRLRLRTSTP